PQFYRVGRRIQRLCGEPGAAPTHRRTARHPVHQIHSFCRTRASLAVDCNMSEPVQIAAIDAGSNAVRLAVARAYSALDIEPLHMERYPLRLGETVFLRHRFAEETVKKSVKAFRHFREIMDEFGVTQYRAVATSASREARNRDAFVRQIKKKTGIALEVISSSEESRLGRVAVLAAPPPEAPPPSLGDLRGGSLE